ncbi:hypothetical protein [Streptomyces sp. 7N604]
MTQSSRLDDFSLTAVLRSEPRGIVTIDVDELAEILVMRAETHFGM